MTNDSCPCLLLPPVCLALDDVVNNRLVEYLLIGSRAFQEQVKLTQHGVLDNVDASERRQLPRRAEKKREAVRRTRIRRRDSGRSIRCVAGNADERHLNGPAARVTTNEGAADVWLEGRALVVDERIRRGRGRDLKVSSSGPWYLRKV